MMTKIENLNVPIYDAKLWVVVTDDVVGERQKEKWNDFFGEIYLKEDVTYYGLSCNSDGNKFAIFLHPKAGSKVISHELFHTTHRILEWANVKFGSDCHESAALLHGWLGDKVLEIMGITNDH